MKVLGVIPARRGSTRLPNKPLQPILGRPLLLWTIEGARKSKKLTELLVATDDREIADLAEKAGVRAVMTDAALPSGSDRAWAAVKNQAADLVLSIQGDEPMITGEVLDQLVSAFEEDAALDIATLAHPISEEELALESVVKVVVDSRGRALYFSRFPIPYSRNKEGVAKGATGCQKHIGVYAYRKEILRVYCETPVCEMEKAESLEQLRALYLGAKIQVVSTNLRLVGVDTPEDVKRVEKILSQVPPKAGQPRKGEK